MINAEVHGSHSEGRAVIPAGKAPAWWATYGIDAEGKVKGLRATGYMRTESTLQPRMHTKPVNSTWGLVGCGFGLRIGSRACEIAYNIVY